jgi:tetratricopeptide (TPR) repeat protein
MALDVYTHIFTNYPDHRLATHALFNSAVCEKQLKHPDKALEYFQKLLNDYGTDPLAQEAGLQAGLLLEKTGKTEEALKAYEITMKSPEQDLAVEASYYHADLLKQEKKYDDARKEFDHLIVTYPSQDQWVVTAYAKIAETYEEQQEYTKAVEEYKKILKYTKVKAYRTATNKRIKALQPFLKKKSKSSTDPTKALPTPESSPKTDQQP